MTLFARAILITAIVAGTLQAQTPADIEFFEAKVRPLLVEHCQKCHGETKQRGGLRLDFKAAWQMGGDSGPAIIPGKADKSLLIRMVKPGRETPPQMPKDTRLSDEQVAVLAKWIDNGAHDPRTGTSKSEVKEIDWKKAETFWAFQPLKVEVPPGTQTPIDRFVAAKLKEKGLTPVSRADRLALVRRATFTLTGLPPTQAEVEAFQRDESAEAFAKVVDRLLASPRYGEHQARYWLDVARYGEDVNFTLGKEGIVNAWRYRDWVIDAFNSDLSYDRFVKYQIAADRYEETDKEPKHLAALGLFGLGQLYVSNGDPLRAKAETLDDRVDTLTRGFLALTVSCARCHDHKFDPIPTIDYYSIAGIFDSTKMADVPLAPKAEVDAYESARKIASAADARVKDLVQVEKDRVAHGIADKLPNYMSAVWLHHAKKFEQPGLKVDADAQAVGLDKEAFTRLMKYIGRRDAPNSTLKAWTSLLPTKPGERNIPADVKKIADAYMQAVKKNLDTPYPKRNLDIQNDLFGMKGVFQLADENVIASATPDRKSEYAALKAEAKAKWDKVPPPLPMSHGISEAPKMGDVKVALRGNPYKPGPVAPRRFLRILGGEQRTLFKDGSGRRELAEAIADPNNPLTARVWVNRIWQQHFGKGIVATPSNFGSLGEAPSHPELLDYLAAQFIKGGWSVKKLHREILLSETFQRSSSIVAKNQELDPENRWLWRMNRRRVTVEGYRDSLLAAAGTLDLTMGGKSESIDDVANRRRTVYGKISRLDLSQLLRLFDFPDANITSDRRTETTVPQQLLFAINSPFAVAQAKALAKRVEAEADSAAQVRAAYWFALSRAATEAEVTVAARYLAKKEEPETKNALTRLERFAQAILASNEFVYVD